MKTQNILTLLFSTLALASAAAPLTFDFKDPNNVNNVVFKLDAPLEAINGSASGITGKVTFDPDNPKTVRGKIVVAANSLKVPNGMMEQHMHGDKWLNVSQHPEITFEVKEVRNANTQADVTTAEVLGLFTLKGVSKEKTIPVKMTYLKDKLSQRVPAQKGDLLVLRSDFNISRKDFDIQAGAMEDKVADKIDLSLSIAGAAAR